MADADIGVALEREVSAWLGYAPKFGGVPVPFGGGQSAECYRFELLNGPSVVPARLVLRLMRDDQSAARECAIQNAVVAAKFPAVAILRNGGSVSAFRRPFSIMAFVEGRDPVADGAVRRIPQILAETMCALHALPVQTLCASLEEANVAAVIGELRRSERSEIARAALWFDANGIDGADEVLCHGDLHPGNLLMDRGRVVAVLDWEIAVFAPRAYDVARMETILLLMPGVGSALIRPLVRLLGRRAARQFVGAYLSRAAVDRVTLERCRALHALRLVALARSPGLAAQSVRSLWRPFERTLARRWERLTGVLL